MKKQGMATTTDTSLPPAYAKGKGKNSKPPKPIAMKPGSVYEDSSWIKKQRGSPTTREQQKQQRTKKIAALRAMTTAFQGSMRCSLEEAECQTSMEDRIDCIHFGSMLVALDVMKDCMETYGMTRTKADLEYHVSNARLLYGATPPESRDDLSSLLMLKTQKSKAGQQQKQEQDFYHESLLKRSFSIEQQDLSSPELNPNERKEKCCAAKIQTSNPSSVSPKPVAAAIATPIKDDESSKVGGGEYSAPSLLKLGAADRERARNSMFWLCNFVRYTYNVHRLVLQIGHDPVDASSMAFMRYLQPYFGDYYSETNDAKAFLKLLIDYQNEHFLGDSSSSNSSSNSNSKENDNALDSQSLRELKFFLAVLEIVMYLWTPAFQEMAQKIGELLSP